jgi:hypothetical protein
MGTADLGVVIMNSRGERVTELVCSDCAQTFSLEPGNYQITVSVADLPLAPGPYFVNAWVVPTLGGYTCDIIYDYPLFAVVKEGHIYHYQPPIPWGAVHCQGVEWKIADRGDAK